MSPKYPFSSVESHTGQYPAPRSNHQLKPTQLIGYKHVDKAVKKILSSLSAPAQPPPHLQS